MQSDRTDLDIVGCTKKADLRDVFKSDPSNDDVCVSPPSNHCKSTERVSASSHWTITLTMRTEKAESEVDGNGEEHSMTLLMHRCPAGQ